MQLRYYQEEAIHAIRNSLNDGCKSPIACLPTGAGKALTICDLVHKIADRIGDDRIVVAVHTKELVEQLAKTYERVSGCRPGVYSASLHRREIRPVTFCQIQSVFKKAFDFGRIGMVVIDEADRCPVEGTGQYRTFLNDARLANPDLRLVGFTATPYRTGSGLVYGEGQPFEALVYDIGIKQLIEDGFLSKITSKDGGVPDLSNVHVRQGEYVSSELETVMTDEALVERACDEIIRYGQSRIGWVLFSSGSKHATMLHEKMRSRGVFLPVIEGSMKSADRDNYINAYKRRELQGLININVLSVGFDAPHTDLIGCLRPTLSPGMYYQQIGRGFRICEGKRDCLVLDMAGNVARHGPIDTLNQRIKTKAKGGKGEAPVKTCQECMEIVPAGCRKCPACGSNFPDLRIAKHEAVARADSPISSSEVKSLAVTRWQLQLSVSRVSGKPSTVIVRYWNGLTNVTEWLSLDANSHPFARQKALQFIHENPRTGSDTLSLFVRKGKLIGVEDNVEVQINTAAESMRWLDSCLLKPSSIRYQTPADGEKYPRVLSRHYDT